MRRRQFLKQASVATLFAWASPPWSHIQAGEPPKPSSQKVRFTTPPSLQCATAEGVTVAIGVDGPSTAWVEYGETEALGKIAWGSRHGLKPVNGRAHHIRLETLQPGRRIFYRVRACPVEFRNV